MPTRKAPTKATPGGVAARAELRAWLVNGSKGYPQWWADLAARACDAPDGDLWPDGVEGMPLFVVARSAMLLAIQETHRSPKEEEREAFDKVASAVDGLRKAIVAAPLPRGGTAYTIDDGGHRQCQVLVGWRGEYIPERAGYRLAVLDLLAVADELLQRHRETLPTRVIERRRPEDAQGRPEATAFVRQFVHLFDSAITPPMAPPPPAAIRRAAAAWCQVAIGQSLSPNDVKVAMRLRKGT